MMRSFRRAAFTYVELMIVLTILAILAAIAVPNFLEAKVRASVSRSRADLTVVKMAIESYRLDRRAYPLNSTPGVTNPYDLVPLTTPIAYLTYLPYDIFTSRESHGDNRPRPVPPVPHQYFNAMQVSPERGLKIISSGGFDSSGFITGLIWGNGPGSPLPGQATPEWLKITPATSMTTTGEATLLPYDPTNGTTSAGHIYARLP